MSDDQYVVQQIPISKIYSDNNFNCRGVISKVDVADLATDIRENTLMNPIMVQPASDVEGGLPEGFDFRIIAGHRRFHAWLVLDASWEPGDKGPGGVDVSENPYKSIPSMVKTGLDEITARVLNLGENLKRKDLDIMQEASAIAELEALGVPRDDVARKLGVSSGWVQTRYYVLRFPEDVQAVIAEGLMNQLQIKQVYSYLHKNDMEGMYEAVRKIKDAVAKGKKGVKVGKRKAQPTNVAKERKARELQDMANFLGKHLGFGPTTRALAWAAGNITTEELFDDVREAIIAMGKEPPFFPKEF